MRCLRATRAAGVWTFLLVLATAPAALRATTVVAKSFAQLCEEADSIFVGTVDEVRSEWADRATMSIETVVRFSAVVPVRGTAADGLELRFAGGEVEGLREEIAGVPRFTVGQRVLLFARHGAHVSPLVGFHQGYFEVESTDAGPVVLTGAREPVLGIEDGRLRLGAPEADLDTALPLEEFLDQVRHSSSHEDGSDE
jgi:hypothetical protein